MKIHIFGASGSGTTTLGKTIAQQWNWTHLDADDYYWEKTDPPFQTKVPLEQRNKNLLQDFNASENVVVSGSMISWGEHWATAFDWMVFLYIPSEIRMERLRKRERERYGTLLDTDPSFQANSQAFLEWAAQYDIGTFEGRSLVIHNAWIDNLRCPVLRIEGDTSIKQRVKILTDYRQYFARK
ncbi:MAG: AAA family ATPase [Bacteroidota bacterium]